MVSARIHKGLKQSTFIDARGSASRGPEKIIQVAESHLFPLLSLLTWFCFPTLHLTHSFTDIFTFQLSCSFLHFSIHPSIHPFLLPCIHACLHSFIHPFLHASMHVSIHSSFYPFNYSSIPATNYSLVPLFLFYHSVLV